MQKIFCILRKTEVACTPEELVRQRLVLHMMENLGYPPHLLALEKSLDQMPHLTKDLLASAPNRRADLVCFAPNIHPDFPLYPLLLVECKADFLKESARSQVIGYNHFLKACFIAIVNGKEAEIGWYDGSQKHYCFRPGFPSYKQLVMRFSNLVAK